jgi:hypothetical protein
LVTLASKAREPEIREIDGGLRVRILAGGEKRRRALVRDFIRRRAILRNNQPFLPQTWDCFPWWAHLKLFVTWTVHV